MSQDDKKNHPGVKLFEKFEDALTYGPPMRNTSEETFPVDDKLGEIAGKLFELMVHNGDIGIDSHIYRVTNRIKQALEAHGKAEYERGRESLKEEWLNDANKDYELKFAFARGLRAGALARVQGPSDEQIEDASKREENYIIDQTGFCTGADWALDNLVITAPSVDEILPSDEEWPITAWNVFCVNWFIDLDIRQEKAILNWMRDYATAKLKGEG